MINGLLPKIIRNLFQEIIAVENHEQSGYARPYPWRDNVVVARIKLSIRSAKIAGLAAGWTCRRAATLFVGRYKVIFLLSTERVYWPSVIRTERAMREVMRLCRRSNIQLVADRMSAKMRCA